MRRSARLVAASAVLYASEPQGPVSDNLKKLLLVEERVIEDERPIGHAMMREQAIDHALSEKGRMLGASLSPPAECVQDSWDDPGSRSASDPDLLTAREREVIGHVVRGQTNQEISRDLGISERCAANRIRRIPQRPAL